MSEASEALAEVRGWLCDNLSSGDAGKACGMLSAVSRHIAELEDENAKLLELVYDMWNDMNVYYVQHERPDSSDMDFYHDLMRELGIEVE